MVPLNTSWPDSPPIMKMIPMMIFNILPSLYGQPNGLEMSRSASQGQYRAELNLSWPGRLHRVVGRAAENIALLGLEPGQAQLAVRYFQRVGALGLCVV